MNSRPFREARISVDAIARNVVELRRLAPTKHLMAVVKADGYGHGAVTAARAALEAGADHLGVADIHEALELRRAGIDAPVLAWLHDPDADFAAAIAAGVDLGLSSAAQLEAVAAAAREGAGRAFVQLKLETGLSRNGIAEEHWDAVFARAHALEESGEVVVRGIFSHVSNASPEDDRAAVAAYLVFGVPLAQAVAVALVQHACLLAAMVGPGYLLTVWRSLGRAPAT